MKIMLGLVMFQYKLSFLIDYILKLTVCANLDYGGAVTYANISARLMKSFSFLSLILDSWLLFSLNKVFVLILH